MKGFKPTGNGPKSGHSFSSDSGFSGSTGMVKSIGPYVRKAPKFAKGGSTKRSLGGPVAMKSGGKMSSMGALKMATATPKAKAGKSAMFGGQKC